MGMPNIAFFAFVPFLLIYLPLLALVVYCLILFIRLANRAIVALDIYIAKNRKNPY